MSFGLNPHLVEAVQQDAVFDGIKEAAEQIAISPIDEKRAIHAISELRQVAFAIVLNTASIVSEYDPSDEDSSTPSEVFDHFMSSVVDDDADEMVNTHLSAHIYDVLDYIGVDETTINDMFDDDVELADTAVEAMTDIVIENLPDDGEPLDEWVDAFVYGDESDDDEAFDAIKTQVHFSSRKSKPVLGGTTIKRMGMNKTAVKYKGEKAIRNGKVTIVNKRVGGGQIKLSAKQKASLKKARMKAGTSAAIKKRVRSFNKGAKMGLHKNK